MSFHVITGKNDATIKEQNNNDWDIKSGNNSEGKIIPTSKDFEKSGLGNKRIPPINPMTIETYAFFSLNDFE